MNQLEIEFFLSQKNYDIRVHKNARWIDQKCTFDVVCMIADCILQFVQNDQEKSFSTVDIWKNQYTIDNVVAIFSKPSPDDKKAKNEYDKYFGQPIKLLAYSGILSENTEHRPYTYQIVNFPLLEHIALRERNALNFLILYIKKVLKDSDLWSIFDDFFKKQTKDSFASLKNAFTDFTIKHTKINETLECGRIFTKILNPLAYINQKRGTEKGRLSKTIITQSDLQYNRENWRDQLSGKDKNIVRADHNYLTENKYNQYKIQKAKRIIRNFNNQYRNGISEVVQDDDKNLATQIHHIFATSDYPSIADYLENLIALTPNQHNLQAHPQNHTKEIDRDFQYICLLAKTYSIWENLTQKSKQPTIYNFEDYKIVLNTGLETQEFTNIADCDFKLILNKIELFYDKMQNKYANIINENNYIS
ncbi:restriction endonuclease [Campylobacter lari]|uniref:restriction endonuclease n=1 Tax=Campylobacter lari TaxID=201 RepID=UPI0021BF1778|nr:restriction endonuclease [Campylobacter lari]